MLGIGREIVVGANVGVTLTVAVSTRHQHGGTGAEVGQFDRREGNGAAPHVPNAVAIQIVELPATDAGFAHLDLDSVVLDLAVGSPTGGKRDRVVVRTEPESGKGGHRPEAVRNEHFEGMRAGAKHLTLGRADDRLGDHIPGGVGVVGPDAVLVEIDPGRQISLAGNLDLEGRVLAGRQDAEADQTVLVVSEDVAVVALGIEGGLTVQLGIGPTGLGTEPQAGVDHVELVTRTVIDGQSRIWRRRVAEVQPAVVVEDLDLRLAVVDDHAKDTAGQAHDARSGEVQEEPLIQLGVDIAVDAQLDRFGHFRLGLGGHHEFVDLAVETSPDNHLLAEQRIAIPRVKVAGDVLRNRAGAQFRVHDLPIVAKMPGFPNHLVALDLGKCVVEVGVGRDVGGKSGVQIVVENVPIAAVTRRHPVVTLPDHVDAGNLRGVVVLRIIGQSRVDAGTDLVEVNFVVRSVPTFPNHVVAVDLDPTVPGGVGRHLDDLVGDVLVEVDLEVLAVVTVPDHVGTRNLRVVVVQADMVVDLGGNGLGDAGVDVE